MIYDEGYAGRAAHKQKQPRGKQQEKRPANPIGYGASGNGAQRGLYNVLAVQRLFTAGIEKKRSKIDKVDKKAY